MKKMTKIAVTGMGIITPLGIGKDLNWQRLIQGESQVRYEISDGAFLARVEEISLEEPMRQLAMAFLAVNGAASEAGLDNAGYEPERIGISVGESKFNLFSRSFNAESSLYGSLRKLMGICGPASCSSAACATGALNIIQGCRMIEEGECDAVICGTAETSIHPLYINSFKNMGVLSKNGVKPFDKDRDGFGIGEGAGFIIIEDMKKAVFRGANIYCEIAGRSCGMFSDNLLSISSSSGMEKIIKKAVNGEIPEFVHMHGTGTKLNDHYESMAISKSFENASKIPLSSTKGATGHLLGVSAMAGAIFSILALKNNTIPPTANFHETDIPFGLNYTPAAIKNKTIMSALSLSFGFGGQGAALYFKKPWTEGIY